MKKLSLILIFLALITFHSCDLFNMDNDPSLPEITQEGKGTFGCLIDGELFLPKGPDPTGGMRGNPHAKYTEASGTLIIQAQNTDSWRISLLHFPLVEEGNYLLTKNCVLHDLTTNSCEDYIIDSLASSLTITLLDKDNDIVSGIFSGNFVNECDSTNIIHITEGRFDLSYTL